MGLGRRLYLNNAFLNYVINDVISRLHCNSIALEIKVPGQVDGNSQAASLFDTFCRREFLEQSSNIEQIIAGDIYMGKFGLCFIIIHNKNSWQLAQLAGRASLPFGVIIQLLFSPCECLVSTSSYR